MPAVVEARTILCAIPQDTLRGESRGVWLQRTAEFFGLSQSEAVKIYYRRKERMDADKLAVMRERLNQLEERAAQRQGMIDGIKEQLAYLRSTQGSRDPGGDRSGDGPLDSRGLGEGEGSGGEGGRSTAVARPDEEG